MKADMLIICLVLVIATIQDIRNKKINIIFPLAGAILSAALHVMWDDFEIKSVAYGMVIGLILMVFSKISRGGVGMGDGLLITCTGIILGFEKNMELFFTGLILCGMWGAFLLFIMKKSKKTEVPFAPFLLAAYLIIEGIPLLEA